MCINYPLIFSFITTLNKSPIVNKSIYVYTSLKCIKVVTEDSGTNSIFKSNEGHGCCDYSTCSA